MMPDSGDSLLTANCKRSTKRFLASEPAPVALFIYNRAVLVERVAAEILQARPSALFLIADGPRSPDDEIRCNAARTAVDRIDWHCPVLRSYSDVNLGCRIRVSSGLDWVFAQSETAIIIEDDCVPHPTFFPFCQELLKS
jgi:hypothetical protein